MKLQDFLFSAVTLTFATLNTSCCLLGFGGDAVKDSKEFHERVAKTVSDDSYSTDYPDFFKNNVRPGFLYRRLPTGRFDDYSGTLTSKVVNWQIVATTPMNRGWTSSISCSNEISGQLRALGYGQASAVAKNLKSLSFVVGGDSYQSVDMLLLEEKMKSSPGDFEGIYGLIQQQRRLIGGEVTEENAEWFLVKGVYYVRGVNFSISKASETVVDLDVTEGLKALTGMDVKASGTAGLANDGASVFKSDDRIAVAVDFVPIVSEPDSSGGFKLRLGRKVELK